MGSRLNVNVSAIDYDKTSKALTHQLSLLEEMVHGGEDFDVIIYSQRNKTETIFSVVKRRFGSELDSHNDVMKTKELLYRVLAYNCHRMCIISCFVLVMISRKPYG